MSAKKSAKPKKMGKSELDVNDVVNYADIVALYPLQAQAAIYLLLESVNAGYMRMLPICDCPTYDDDIHRLIDTVVEDRDERELTDAVLAVGKDLRSTLERMPQFLEEVKKCDDPTETLGIEVMLYCVLMLAIQEILKDVRERVKDDVLALLADHKTVKGLPYFESLSTISNRISAKVLDTMQKHVEDFGRLS